MSTKTTQEGQTLTYRVELFAAPSIATLQCKPRRQAALRVVSASVAGRSFIRYRVDNSGIK